MNTIVRAFLEGFAHSMGTNLATGLADCLSIDDPNSSSSDKKVQVKLMYLGRYAVDQFGTWIWVNAEGKGWALDPRGNFLVANLAMLSLQPRSHFYLGTDGKHYMHTGNGWHVYTNGTWQTSLPVS
jgi:hypothetical protein